MFGFSRSYAVALAFLVAAFLTTAVAPRSEAHEVPTAQQVGTEPIEVGQTAPDFTLADPDGKNHTASALRGEKNLLVVFFRGAW